jgi:excisionase family DNA binding protein
MQTSERAAARIPAHLRELVDALPVMLTFRETQAVLHTSTRTLRSMLARGELRYVRSQPAGSARVLIPRAELLRWLIERSQ